MAGNDLTAAVHHLRNWLLMNNVRVDDMRLIVELPTKRESFRATCALKADCDGFAVQARLVGDAGAQITILGVELAIRPKD